MKGWNIAKKITAGLLSIAVLAGCGTTPQSTADRTVTILTPGEDRTVLTVGILDENAQRMDTLREIAAKYTADDPNVEITFVGYETGEDMKAAAVQGELDLAEVSMYEQTTWVEDELLLDLRASEAFDVTQWDEYSTLNHPARAVLNSMGQGHAYLLPSEITQPLLVYRKDWQSEYNADKEWQDTVSFETWESTNTALSAIESLGYSGELLISTYLQGHGSARISTTYLPMLLLWSDLGHSALLDTGAGLFHSRSALDKEGAVTEISTIFEGEAAKVSLEGNAELAARSQYITDDQTELVFCSGEAAAIITDRSHLESILTQLPEDAVGVQGLPTGRSGAAITNLVNYTGWGLVQTAHTEEELSAAYDFLLFLCSADNNTHYANVTNTLPIHASAEDLEANLTEGVLSTEMEMISQSGTYRYVGCAAMYGGLWEEVAEQLSAYYTGEQDSETTLQACDTLCKDAFAQFGQAFGVKEQ